MSVLSPQTSSLQILKKKKQKNFIISATKSMVFCYGSLSRVRQGLIDNFDKLSSC